MWTVYRHTSPSGKHYFGITHYEYPEMRWRDGRGYNKRTIFGKAIKKYGWENFEHIVLYNNLTEEQAKQMERSLILEYNTTDTRYGYNGTTGGDGMEFSEETLKKMSKSHLGVPHPNPSKDEAERQRISETMLDYYQTEAGIECRERMSKSHTGKTLSDEHRLNIGQSNIGKHSKPRNEMQKINIKVAQIYCNRFGKKMKPIIMIEYN